MKIHFENLCQILKILQEISSRRFSVKFSAQPVFEPEILGNFFGLPEIFRRYSGASVQTENFRWKPKIVGIILG